MLLKDEDIQEFQKIYKEEFGEPISDREAGIIAARLITLYEALARRLPNEIAQFTDSIEDGTLGLEVGTVHVDKPPASEKVVL